MTEHTTTSHGDRVGFDRYGSGPAVVFVAGAGPFRAIDPVTTSTAQALAGHGFTTVVPDRLGRGDSAAQAPLHLERERAAIGALVEAAGGSAVLVGHSSGCTIALDAAVHGVPVDGLALWEAPVGPQDGPARAWTDRLAGLLDAGDHAGAVEHYMHDMPPEFLAGLKESPIWAAFVANAPSLRVDAESLAWLESGRLADLLAPVGVPVEVITGESTFPELAECAERLAAAIPHATQVTVAGESHSWEPAAMADHLAAFARSVSAG